jgi:hypothetical protein
MPLIESLQIANHAESVNGLLYVSGGGWSDLWLGSIPSSLPRPISHFGVAMTVAFSPEEWDHPYPFRLTLHKESRHELLGVTGELTVTADPVHPTPVLQRATFAANIDTQFEEAGSYGVTLELAAQQRTIWFRVNDAPRPASDGSAVPPPQTPYPSHQ